MSCRIADLRNKQVVCIRNGEVLGYVYDVEFSTETGSLTAIILPGRPRFFGILGRDDDVVIPWSDIEVIGQETVLVSTEYQAVFRSNRHGFFINK